MKIKILDGKTFGNDMIYTGLFRFGDVEIYNSTSSDEVKSRVADADVIILNKVKITKEVIESSKGLKLICVFATGFDNIDIASAKEHGVAVCNVPAYSTSSVALCTVSTVLSLVTHLREYNDYVRTGSYTKSGLPNLLEPFFSEVDGKTWGIIGAGNIGRAVAKVALALGARVIVNKRTHTDEFECVDIDTLCRESDIITIHCPLNDETRNLISKDRIDMMKPEVVIVNEARGAVVNEGDIRDAIINKKISGFGCDVYSREPFDSEHPYNDIKDLNNVILTPHFAWGSVEARARCMSVVCNNISAFMKGERLNRVD